MLFPLLEECFSTFPWWVLLVIVSFTSGVGALPRGPQSPLWDSELPPRQGLFSSWSLLHSQVMCGYWWVMAITCLCCHLLPLLTYLFTSQT